MVVFTARVAPVELFTKYNFKIGFMLNNLFGFLIENITFSKCKSLNLYNIYKIESEIIISFFFVRIEIIISNEVVECIIN